MSDARDQLSQTHKGRRQTHEPCKDVLELRTEHDSYVKRTDERLASGSVEMSELATDIRDLRRELTETRGLIREVLSAVNAQRINPIQNVDASTKSPELKLPGGSGVKGPAWVVLTISIFGIVFLGVLSGVVYVSVERFKSQTVQPVNGK